MMAGGEHHSIAVTAEGKVYCWGRNDEGQCGRGDLYGQHKRQKAREEYEKMMQLQAEEEERKKQQVVPLEEEKKAEVVVSQAAVKNNARKQKMEKTKEEQYTEKEEDLNGIGYFSVPQLVP